MKELKMDFTRFFMMACDPTIEDIEVLARFNKDLDCYPDEAKEFLFRGINTIKDGRPRLHKAVIDLLHHAGLEES